MIRWAVATQLLALALATAVTACGSEDGGASARPPAAVSPTAASPASEQAVMEPVYIALGDSLSAGIGASKRGVTDFVPLVHESLGDDHQLTNLGHGGDTSGDLVEHGHLDEAIAIIEQRNSDDGAGNDVSLVTLEIGGNDLLGLYFSSVLTGVCPDVDTALSNPDCYEPLADRLSTFGANFGPTLDQLLAADPQLRLLVLTLYDPFAGVLPVQSEIAALALEGMPGTRFSDGLNDIIRDHAARRGIPVVDLYEPFRARGPGLMAGDIIHPNDDGYRLMADEVIAVLATLP